MRISHESIYQYIYVKAKGELKKHLLKYLRQKGRKNINRKLSNEKRGQIPDAISIHEDPKKWKSRAIPRTLGRRSYNGERS
jgi:IS30 family transposase